MSESKKIFEAIPKITAEVGFIAKEKKNSQQGFMYRGIDDLYMALQKLMAKHGVFSVPSVLEERRDERQSKSGSTLIHAIARIQYRFYADDGSFVDAITLGEGMDSGDKSGNKAMSIAHKYALIQVFTIPTGEEDADATSHEVQPKAKPINPLQHSGAFCVICGTELILSESKKGYYCPRFKENIGPDGKTVEHTRFIASELEPFRAQQKSDPASFSNFQG